MKSVNLTTLKNYKELVTIEPSCASQDKHSVYLEWDLFECCRHIQRWLIHASWLQHGTNMSASLQSEVLENPLVQLNYFTNYLFTVSVVNYCPVFTLFHRLSCMRHELYNAVKCLFVKSCWFYFCQLKLYSCLFDLVTGLRVLSLFYSPGALKAPIHTRIMLFYLTFTDVHTRWMQQRATWG